MKQLLCVGRRSLLMDELLHSSEKSIEREALRLNLLRVNGAKEGGYHVKNPTKPLSAIGDVPDRRDNRARMSAQA